MSEKPQDFVQVPREPTDQMCLAGMDGSLMRPVPGRGLRVSVSDEEAGLIYRAMIEAAPAAPGGWRTMDSAPRDGTEILGFGSWAGEIHGPTPEPPCRAIIRWSGGRGDHPGYDWDVMGGDAYGSWLKPTHWTELPHPPKGGE